MIFKNRNELFCFLALLFVAFVLLILIPLTADAQESDMPDIGLRIEIAGATRFAIVKLHAEVSKLDDPSVPIQQRTEKQLKKMMRVVRKGNYNRACSLAWEITHSLRAHYGFPQENEQLWDATDNLLFLHCTGYWLN